MKKKNKVDFSWNETIQELYPGKEQNKKDCFTCGQSMVDEDDKLFCVVHKKIVQDEETCEEYN